MSSIQSFIHLVERFVQPKEMPFLLRAMEEIENETFRDYFRMLLLTGARKTNVLMMRWEEINWDRMEWRIPITKNGDSVVIPLVPRAIDMLKYRLANSKSEWVFENTRNKKRHIPDPTNEWSQILARATLYIWQEHENVRKIIGHCQIQFNDKPIDKVFINAIIKKAKIDNIILPTSLMDLRLHDIRRTFGSYQALTGASLITIGKSLGHKSTDATQIYARLNNDAVRTSIEKATDAMFRK